MFAGMVLFGAAWTLKVNEHVRVDLVYGMVSDRARIWIDLIGGMLFLMPMCIDADLFHLAVVRRRLVLRRSVDQRRRPGALAGEAHPAGRLRARRAAGRLRDHQVHRGAHDPGYKREHAYEKPLQ